MNSDDKKRRTQFRSFRKLLRLKQTELDALAGVSLGTVARFERGKQISLTTADRVTTAIFMAVAKRNPEAINRAVQPVLEAVEKWERILSLELGSETAIELERLNGKSLAELKTQAETTAGFLRRGANIGLSLTK